MCFSPIFGQVQGSFKGSFYASLFTYEHTRLFGWCGTRGGGGGLGVFPFPNSSSVKLDYSNFGQDVLWEKMNILQQKIRIKSIISSL